VASYDERTGILFSGVFLLPGRLLTDDAKAYPESVLRVIDFLKTRPLTHILGGHIELDATGHAYRFGSHYHPNEHRLELARADLTALPAAFERFNGFYARYPNYILTNPKRSLRCAGNYCGRGIDLHRVGSAPVPTAPAWLTTTDAKSHQIESSSAWHGNGQSICSLLVDVGGHIQMCLKFLTVFQYCW
jgi:hypothetical protein